MNGSNQIYFLALLGFAFLLIGILSGIVVYLLLKSKDKEKNKKASNSANEDSARPTFEGLQNCHFHENEPGKGSCCMCEKSCCDTCLKEYDGLTFCPEHLRTFSENKWIDITNVKTTPNNPEAAIYIYEFKKELWNSRSIPTYIVTHYKINIDGDHIESYVMLYVRSQDEEVLRNKINQIN
ncbi:MAG: hypothetical protein CME70_07140 [Halobacteriovorax sp.]|nr:hypothetical protein [Halobacteriovorax sp.]|tara:strand:- start:414275 stop:414817 length:543 start_codon:yes stop_codon:yes gene_type:complete